ncbi:MAG: diacylglycerol kinase [bacterium]|jgi:diacylglycerol kinase (ATP)|nr:diacylglycerol kinase [bacterium]
MAFPPRRLRAAFGYSRQGLAAAWRSEASFRDEVWLSAILLPLACWLGENGVERALLAASWLLVPLVELLNTAVEVLVERIDPAFHPLSGRAKDLGSAAVLLAMLVAALVWWLVLLG